MAERPVTGSVIAGRYVLREKIGSGGMAEVWLAGDSELDREVAVKILHDRFAADEEFVERFRREARSAAGLQHPNVVSIFDRGEFDGTYFIAMEYVSGPSMKRLVQGGMGVPDAINFTRQILAAAGFAHRNGIVHRDLKPQNVLIDDEGRARVADFGIAGRTTTSDITQTGSVMGTAEYLPPEQAQGKETTPQSDIYSIGVILYEALTGRVPFEGETAVAIALKQVSETPRRPSAINPVVPPALDAVVMRALAKEPERRFRDADAFLKALDAAESAPDSPRPEDTASFAPIGVAGTQIRSPEDAEAADEGPGRARSGGRWLLIAMLVAAVAGLVAYSLTRPGTVAVPNVEGQTIGQATQVIEDRGLDVSTEYVQNSNPRDLVLEQSPLAGEKVTEGSTVTLTVSAGPGTVQIPDVSGLTEKQATAQLEQDGFDVKPRFVFSKDVPEDRVVGTDPAAGTQIQTGSTIGLLISRGQNKVEVPNLTGLQESAALNVLADADLTGSVSIRDSGEPEGQVVGQSPSAGRMVAKGSQITIFVSSGTALVPDTVGMIRKAAVTLLKQTGFVASVTQEETLDPTMVGLVIDQFPPAGSRGKRGDTVTIVVGILPGP